MPFRLKDSSAQAEPVPASSPEQVQAVAQASPPPPVAAGPSPSLVQVEPATASPLGAPVTPPSDIVDVETRYALGMAYKDMELWEEAKEEFMSSMKDSGFFVDSCMMMALCLKEQNQPQQAIQLLEKLVVDSRCRGGNAQLVRYELGLLYEKTEACDRALVMYQSIPTFHDVPRRLEGLRARGSNGIAPPGILVV